MKTDLYTKSVLTIIAICLTVIVLAEVDIIPKAQASSLNTNYGLVPVNADGSIDVNIKSATADMNVNISNITTFDKLNVNVKSVDTNAFNSCTVPVKNKE